MNEDEQAKARYRLNEQAAEQRLAELRRSDGIDSLQNEIALVRMLIEDRINAGSEKSGTVQLCVSLLQTLDRLQKTQLAIQLKSGDLLERKTVLALAEEIAAMLAAELREVENGEAICDRIIGKMAATIGAATN